MAALKFASSHNMVAFLDKPTESDGFEQIVDFLNAHPIKYALTVNPTIYTSCIEQFWTTAKVKTVNGEVQIQALVDKKKVIITETSVRSDLQLEDAEVFMDKQVEGMYKHKEIYVTSSHTKKVFSNMKTQGKDFSGRDTPLFPTMIVQAQEQVGEGSEIPTDSHHTPTTTQPSTSKPWKKQSRRKQRKDTEDHQLSGPTEHVTDDTENVASVPTHSNDPLLSGEDRLKLNELMELCTSLSQRVLDLEKTKTSQAAEITELKERVKKLEKKRGSRTHKLRRLYKGRKIDEIYQDAEVTLVDETQGRYGDNLMFDNDVLDNEQDMAEKEVDMAEKDVSTVDPVTTTGKAVTIANVVVSTAKVTTDSTTTTTVDELTLAQTLIKIKAAKPKDVTTAVTRPKARGVAKDKGKEKMVEPEKPLKKKDQIMFDKEVAQKLQTQLDAELEEEEEKLARQREEDANITEWDNVQAMMDADYKLAARLQAEEQGELTIEEKSRLFVELINKRKKHFARLVAEEQRRKPPTKAQKRNTMSTYLKNMAGYKHNQLETKSFEDIQMLFDKEMKRVNTFVDMDTELVKGSETRTEGSSKRAGEELKSKNLKKHKLDENVEVEVDNDQEEAEIKKHMEIVPDDEVTIDSIPLATKPPIIVDWKIIKERKMGYFQIIRADGSLKRYEVSRRLRGMLSLVDPAGVRDVILHEKLLNIKRLIANIESLNDNSTPNCVLKSTSLFPIPDITLFIENLILSLSYSDNSLPEFESFSYHTEETSSGSTTTHANNSLPEYDSFHFEIKPDQGGYDYLVMVDIL
ncbi:hypothetical protein Tco_0679295 [Tanacetum coccineum]|uniref:Xylulose kinase-1 n=1 Tax=Tanacetum coccineum TaxID=301880 RepID=A0ABQ4XHL5_9ASTR